MTLYPFLSDLDNCDQICHEAVELSVTPKLYPLLSIMYGNTFTPLSLSHFCRLLRSLSIYLFFIFFPSPSLSSFTLLSLLFPYPNLSLGISGGIAPKTQLTRRRSASSSLSPPLTSASENSSGFSGQPLPLLSALLQLPQKERPRHLTCRMRLRPTTPLCDI